MALSNIALAIEQAEDIPGRSKLYTKAIQISDEMNEAKHKCDALLAIASSLYFGQERKKRLRIYLIKRLRRLMELMMLMISVMSLKH